MLKRIVLQNLAIWVDFLSLVLPIQINLCMMKHVILPMPILPMAIFSSLLPNFGWASIAWQIRVSMTTEKQDQKTCAQKFT